MSNLQIWRPNQIYEIGAQTMYNNTLYKCLVKHKSIDAWNPMVKPQYWRVNQPTAVVSSMKR